jgi:hypothetical protein
MEYLAQAIKNVMIKIIETKTDAIKIARNNQIFIVLQHPQAYAHYIMISHYSTITTSIVTQGKIDANFLLPFSHIIKVYNILIGKNTLS